MRRHLILTSILAAFLIVQGCSALQPRSPSVTLAGIEVLEAGFFEQRFTCKLRVQNPNDFDLPLTGLEVEVEINGQPFARGVSNKPVTVPRLGEEVLEVAAVSTLSNIMRQIMELGKEKPGLTYRVKGRLATSSLGWLNFNETGTFGGFQNDRKERL